VLVLQKARAGWQRPDCCCCGSISCVQASYLPVSAQPCSSKHAHHALQQHYRCSLVLQGSIKAVNSTQVNTTQFASRTAIYCSRTSSSTNSSANSSKSRSRTTAVHPCSCRALLYGSTTVQHTRCCRCSASSWDRPTTSSSSSSSPPAADDLPDATTMAILSAHSWEQLLDMFYNSSSSSSAPTHQHCYGYLIALSELLPELDPLPAAALAAAGLTASHRGPAAAAAAADLDSGWEALRAAGKVVSWSQLTELRVRGKQQQQQQRRRRQQQQQQQQMGGWALAYGLEYRYMGYGSCSVSTWWTLRCCTWQSIVGL